MDPCDADYDGSGVIGVGDLALQALAWRAQDGSDGNYDLFYDPIRDGVIRVDDLMWVAQHLGVGCPGP